MWEVFAGISKREKGVVDDGTRGKVGHARWTEYDQGGGYLLCTSPMTVCPHWLSFYRAIILV